MVEYLRKLVAEKLMDPESFTQTDDQALQKLLAEKSFAMSANPQVLVQDYRYNLEKQVKGAKIEMIPVPLGPAGPVVLGGTRLENGVMISSKALKSDSFVAMMQFVDWLWYSDEGQRLARWGVEGVTYTRSGSGTTSRSPASASWAPTRTPRRTCRRTTASTTASSPTAAAGELVSSMFSPDEKKFQDAMAQREQLPIDPAHPLQSFEQEQATLWDTPLKDTVIQNTLKFVLGKRPLSQWDAYLAELKAKNMQQLVDLHNKAYERFKKENG